MAAKKTAAEKAPAKGKVVELRPKAGGRALPRLRPATAKSGTSADGVARFSLQNEMLQLLGRVSGNKSKRTATALVDDGPIRAFMVALDEGATLEEDAIDGNVSLQVLIGEADVKIGRARRRLHVGDLLVLEAGSARGVEAIDPTVLLITIATSAE
jgi:quercetin dioxygenase-like cupin family protein